MDARYVQNEEERELLIKFIKNHALPFAISIFEGHKRTLAQNRLQRLLCNEISSQWPGHNPEYVRGYCKLHFGIPILREQNDIFREKYDRLLKGRSYEEKMEFMQFPIDLPVTRIMSTKQKTQYIDAIYHHFSEKGFILTVPDHGEIG